MRFATTKPCESPLRRATGGEIAAKMSQAKRYVDGHVRVSRDGKEMHVDVKVIRVKGNLNVGRNLYFEGEVKVGGSVIMGNKKDALEEIKRLENEIEEMTAIVEELEGHHTLTDENFHTADNCLTMNNGEHRKGSACELYITVNASAIGTSVKFQILRERLRIEQNSTRTCRDGTRRALRVSTECLKTRWRLTETCQSGNQNRRRRKTKCFETRLRLKVNICAQSTPTRLKIYLRAPDVFTDWVAPSPPPSARIRRRNRPHRRHQNRPNPFHLRDGERRPPPEPSGPPYRAN